MIKMFLFWTLKAPNSAELETNVFSHYVQVCKTMCEHVCIDL